MCLQNHFCNGGEANVTGQCQYGFDCTGGTLQLKAGFWSPITRDQWNHNTTLLAYKCTNDAACAGGDFFGHATAFVGCRAGHQGSLCNECAAGLVGRGGTCIRCHATVLLVFAVLLLPLAVLLLICVLTAVLLQETSGKSQASSFLPLISQMQYLI